MIIRPPKKRKSSVRQGSDEGYALVTTLLTAMLLAFIATVVTTDIRSESLYTRNNSDLIKARELAMSGLQILAHQITLEPSTRAIAADGQTEQMDFAGAQLALSIKDQRGNFDINNVPPEALQNLITTVGRQYGLDAFSAVELADRISLRARNSSDPISNRWKSVEAIRTLPEMSQSLFAALEPDLTVYAFNSSVNANTASKAVLNALPGVSSRLVNRLMNARENGDGRTSLDGADQFVTDAEGPVYFLSVTATLPNGLSHKLRAHISYLDAGEGGSVDSLRILSLY